MNSDLIIMILLNSKICTDPALYHLY
jgi:hypothetical protein